MTQLVFCKKTLSMLREKLNFFEKLIQYQAARQIPKSPWHKTGLPGENWSEVGDPGPAVRSLAIHPPHLGKYNIPIKGK